MIQDKKYTKSEFINSIRSKYPQYDNIEDDVLYDKILQKYPVYKDMISEQPEEVKKKEGSVLEGTELDFSLVKDSSDIKKSITEEEYDKGDYEFDDRFSAGVNQVLASVSRIPQFIAEQSATALAAFDPDFREKLNSLSREERDIILSGATGLAGPMNITGLTQASKEYSEKAEKIAESFEKFDTSITEDIKAGDLGQATGRLFNEAVGAIPSMIQAFIPAVGIASIGLGSAAEKSKELQDRGYDLNLKTSTNSILTGTAEGLSDLITKKIGGRFFDSVVGKGKDFTVKTVKSFAKSFGIDFAQEGGSEAGSLFVSKAADAIISGDKKAFQDSLYEFTDTFLVGGFATGPLSGGRIGTDIVRQNVRKRRVDNKIKASNYKSISDAFSKESSESVDANQIDVVRSKGAKEILEFELSEKVNKGILTKEDADQRLKSFDEISSLAKETDGLNLDSEKEQKAINLLREKKNLQDAIKEKDESLVKPQQERINQINEELERVQEEDVVEPSEDVVEPSEQATVEEATTEQVSPELEQKLTYKTSGRTQVILDESGKFQKAVDQKTGKERKSKKSIRDAQDELIKQKDYTTGKSAFDGIPPGQEISDPSQLIADRSENPQEVAKEYFEARERESAVDPVIDFFVGRYKVDPKSLPEYYDSKDDLKEVLAYTIKKKGEIATPLDGIAQEVSEMTNQEVTPEQLFQIMKDPRYKSNRAPKEPEVVLSLRNKFIELTGLYGTDKQMKDVANQDPSKLKPPVEPVEVTQEQAESKRELEVEEAVEESARLAEEEAKAAQEPPVEGIANRITKGFKDLGKAIKKQYKIHLTAKGLQPDVIYKEREKRDAAIRMYQNRVDRYRKQLNTALKSVPKDKRDSVMKEFDRVFRGVTIPSESKIPLNIASIAFKMRLEIDALSNSILDSSYFDENRAEIQSLKEERSRLQGVDSNESVEKINAINQKIEKLSAPIETIQANIGSYVNKSYRIFSDSNWPNKVSEEIKENARRFFRKQAIRKGAPLSAQEVENKINEILSKAEDNKYIVRGKDGRIDKKILDKRKDIPAELRALMGEVQDPMTNFSNTVLKQSMLLFNYNFQKKIAEAGDNTFFTKSPTKENTVQIAKEGNEAYKELAGLWTTPEIAKTFEKKNPMNGWIDATLKVSSAIKWGKTVGSIATHLKNILGNHGFVLMQGHLDFNEFAKAADLVIKEFYGKTTEEQKAYLDELISLGVVKQSATLGDITSVFGDRSFEQAYENAITDQARNVFSKKQKYKDAFKMSKVGKKTKQVVDVLNDLYQSEDDFFKIAAYGIEKKRYAEALYGKDPSKLTSEEKTKVNETVAEIVKNTYPTYDRVPPIVKRLGRSPILGAFVSFQAESIRTSFKTYSLIKEELRSNNPKIRAIGARRRASAVSYAAFKLAIASQLGLAAKSFIFGGEEDESEEYNDLKKFLPSWSKKSVIGITSKSPGKYTYIDLSANDPHAFLSKLVVAGKSEDESIFSLVSALQQVGEPFLGKDLVFSWATDAFLIANDKKLTEGEKFERITKEFFKLLEPGTATSTKRLIEAIKDDEKSGLNELKGLSGYRPVDVDIKKSFLFRSKDYRDEKSVITSAFNRVRYDKKASESDIEKALEIANNNYVDLIKRARDLSSSAARLGVSTDDIALTLLKNGFSRRDLAYILSDTEDIVFVPSRLRR